MDLQCKGMCSEAVYMDLQYMGMCSEAVYGPAVYGYVLRGSTWTCSAWVCAQDMNYIQTCQYQNEGVMTSSKHCQTRCSSLAEGIEYKC